MKLIKCYIENFGKLHNFSYEFKDGLNIINEENGFGKTTFATFIKSMFYGLDAGTNVKIENSERKRYFPWQGGIYGGNIEFEIENKKYKIERFFGKKQVDDTFKLYDLSTNLESKDYTENIGEEIFKINKSAYERSTYIPQGKIQIDMEDSLSAKLGNMLESDNDINTSEEALKRLNDSKKIYQKDKGKGGLIDEKKEKLNRLERELENSKSDAQILEAKKQKLDEKVKELSRVENMRKETENLLAKKIEQDRKIAKKETYNTILTRCKQFQEKIAEIDEFLKNEIIEKLEKVDETKIDEGIKNSYKLPEIEKELSIIKEQKEETQKQIKKNKKIYRILLLLGLIFFITGLVLSVTKIQQVIGIIGIIIGIISIGFSFIIMQKGKNNKLIDISKKIEKLEAEIAEIKNEISELIDIDSNSDVLVELTNMKSQYNMLQVKKNEYGIALNQYEYAKKEKERFELENNIEELQKIEEFSDVTEPELREKVFESNRNIDALVDERNQLKNDIEFLENKVDDNEFLESDIANLKEEIINLSKKYQILSKTENLLKSAKERFSSSYLQEMIDGFNTYLKIINNKDMNTNVDIKLDVKIDANGAQKEVKYFSSGYKDLIYLCMRLSLIQSLFKDENPFVMLDDPLVNLDEEKTQKALEVINEFAKKYQILYFVCNSSRI